MSNVGSKLARPLLFDAAREINSTRKNNLTHMPSGFFDFDGLDGIVDTADSDLS